MDTSVMRLGWIVISTLLVASASRYATADEPITLQMNKSVVQAQPITRNEKDTGYRGIWYKIGTTGDEYKYKYSGGLGTYCDHHQSFAVYCDEVKKTFFCYGGTSPNSRHKLWHLVSYYDHETGTVPRPTILLDKQTGDAHDNPVMVVDDKGYLWIFSTSHGRSRPSYIHRSKRPYDIDEFEMVPATRRDAGQVTPLDNFSYMQPSYDPTYGFVCFFTRYNYPVSRTSCFMTSRDGVRWSEFKRLAAIDQGHYQIGAVRNGKAATFFNVHPQGKGLDSRTNLYYMESTDGGETWQSADGQPLQLPLKTANNPALVRDLQAEGLLMYDKDMWLDDAGRPVIAYLTADSSRPGPSKTPRTLRVTRWNGSQWEDHPITTTDHNYDSLSIYLEPDGLWRAIGPTEPGPQPYGTGGEMVMWISRDHGATWQKEKQLTTGSRRNHTYARRPGNAHPDFYAFWADGDARQPSDSHLYFCNREGDVFRLPPAMEGATAKPERVAATTASAEAE